MRGRMKEEMGNAPHISKKSLLLGHRTAHPVFNRVGCLAFCSKLILALSKIYQTLVREPDGLAFAIMIGLECGWWF